MTGSKPQFVFVRCTDADRVEQLRLQAIGCGAELASRWSVIPAAACKEHPSSLNILIPDFRGDADLDLLRSLPKVVEVGTFESDSLQLPDPREDRIEYWRAHPTRPSATAAA